MPAVSRVPATEVFTEMERGTLVRVSTWRGLSLVVHAWMIVALSLLVTVLLPHPLVWLIAVPIIGARQLGLAILMHEAAHGLIHPNRKVNDWVGQWVCGAPVASNLVAYRRYHLKHHKFTQQPEDPDLTLSAPFPRSKTSLRRKVFRDLTGQTYLRQASGLFAAAFGRMPKPNPDATRIARQSLIGFFGISLVITLGIYAISGSWAGLLWFVSFATWFQFVLRIRNIAEHACTSTSEDPFSHARTTKANVLERAIIAPYWVNYHAEHHLFMYVPCYNLKEAHQLLIHKGYGDRMTMASGYGSVLKLVTTLKPAAQHA